MRKILTIGINQQIPETFTGIILLKEKYNGKEFIREKRYYIDGRLQREINAARIIYWDSGKVHTKQWYQDGKLHRLKGAAWKEYSENDQRILSKSFHIYGIVHNYEAFKEERFKLRALCLQVAVRKPDKYNGIIKWKMNGVGYSMCHYLDGRLHRLNGPAVSYFQSEAQAEYHINGISIGSYERFQRVEPYLRR